ncbi:MAG: hypothetical protein V4563_03595 [Pseudomonadota bacterium]
MANSELLRHQKIRSLMAQHPEKVADAAIDLWEQMATQIISIVGEGGFNSLYLRSVFLARARFPWLAVAVPSTQRDHLFTQLQTSLAEQTPEQASAANCLLLITFTDILAALIGEPLTTSILGSAWGNDVSDTANKEFKNEQ